MDDFLHGGTVEFDQQVMKPVRERFEAGKQEARKFKYVGFEVKQTEGRITINQDEYVANIEVPFMKAERMRQKEENLLSP